eukprot:1334381-Amorphochlora_amoeboformis.AAC.1
MFTYTYTYSARPRRVHGQRNQISTNLSPSRLSTGPIQSERERARENEGIDRGGKRDTEIERERGRGIGRERHR